MTREQKLAHIQAWRNCSPDRVSGCMGYLRTSATNGTTNRTSATLTMTGQSFMTSP